MAIDFGIHLLAIPLLGFGILTVVMGIRIVPQTERGLIERFGKYRKYANPGLHIIVPYVDSMRKINITEQMADAKPQEIITSDNLNATVDAQVYFRVEPVEDGVKSSQYNVDDYDYQIINLARTTLRNIIGTLSLKECNSDRNKIWKARVILWINIIAELFLSKREA